VWETHTRRNDRFRMYVAFFNLDDKQVTLHAAWKELGFGGKHAGRSLWDGIQLAPSTAIEITLPAHGSAIYQVE